MLPLADPRSHGCFNALPQAGEFGAGPTINTNTTISLAGVLSRILFVGALTLGVFGVGIIASPTAYAATNQQMNFQGRLLNAQGAVVPDGYYNVQFKIYQDGTGTAASNPGGTLKWTENWLNTSSQGVLVLNGYMSVQLGSINPFGSQVDWNSDTLWLSMNIGNTSSCTITTSFAADCGGDGEMVPMKRLSAVAYAMNATMLGGKTATDFIQNTTTPQSANIAIQSAASGNIGMVVKGASSQSVDLLQLQDSNGLVNGSFNSAGNQLTLGRVATSGTVTQGKLVLSDGTTDGYSLTVQSAVQTGNYTLTLPALAGNATVCTSNSTTNCGNFIQNQTTLQSASNFHISGVGQADTALTSPAIRAVTDGITGIQVQNAAGTTTVLDVDTTNSRIGIGTTAPATALQVAVNNTTVNKQPVLISQAGTGDAGLEIANANQSYYVGIDTSDNSTFKISSTSAANSAVNYGNTAYVSSNPDTGLFNTVTMIKVTLGTAGTVSNLVAHINAIDTSPNNKAAVAIYADSSGSPGSKLTQSSDVTLTAANSWVSFNVTPITVTAGQVVWLAYNTNSSNTNLNDIDYNGTVTSGTARYKTGQNYSVPYTFPSTVTGMTNDTPNLLFYAPVTSPGTDNLTNSLFRLTSNGVATFQNNLDSTAAFQIQNATGSINALQVDTTNGRVGVALAASESAAYDLTMGGSADRVISINTNTSTGAGRQLTLRAGTANGTNQIGGVLLLQGGTGTGTAAGGAVNILGGTTGTGAIGAVNIQTTVNGNVVIGNAGNAGNTVTLTAGATNGINLLSDKIMVGNATTATTIQKTAQTTAATVGQQLTIQGSTSGTTGVGGAVLIQGGNSATGTLGGNVTLAGGTGTTSNGLVILNTSAFQTITNDANCFPAGTESASTSGCTVAQTSVNNYASVIVGFTQDGQTATLPDPSIATAGRVVYVTASNLTKDFTLSVNGGGQGNQIAMRKNTTATMIWNGTDWTAAGASSSTTLQAAYDNTLQSAGGAELVVSKTSATNGLTIRDSSVSPVNGTLLSIQTQSAAGLLSVNSNVTEYASNAGAETAGGTATTFPGSTWSVVGGSTVTRYNTAGNYIATGQGSVSVVTPATANSGVKNQLATTLTANTTYNVSFTTRLLSGTFTDMNVYYSVDGTAASVACTTSASSLTSIWQKVNCTFTTPTSGIVAGNAILIRQTAATARTFYVDNLSVTIAADYNFATDGSVSDAGNFATNWTSAGAGTVSVTRNTSDGYDASDSANVNITAGAANAGLRNKLSSNPLASTLYRITVYAKSSNSFTDFKVRYSPNGGTNYVDCVDYNTQTISTSAWTKVTCYIQTDATAVTTPYIYFVESASAVRSFGVDAFNMSISTITTPNVQVGGGVNGGPTTLFTLDKGASAPIAANNDALLGSMYYDTTLGKLQCYEADGWGACGSSPDNIITISPEYTNAVLHGTGIGTMTSDICSDYLNLNDGSSGQATICGINETYNFYKWTSPQATAQTYSIYVTYQLPTTFKGFNSGQTSLMGRTDNGSSGGSATVQYQIYRNTSSGLTPCGSAVAVSTGTQSTWQIGTASGAADPSTCSFGPSDSIVFKIDVTTSKNAYAYVGNLNFAFSNN